MRSHPSPGSEKNMRVVRKVFEAHGGLNVRLVERQLQELGIHKGDYVSLELASDHIRVYSVSPDKETEGQ